MTSDELGRLSNYELMEIRTEGAGWELGERLAAQATGRAGESAIASRAQVREAAGKVNLDDLAEGNSDYGEGYFAGWRACREAFARALLGLSPDAPSPLEDSR